MNVLIFGATGMVGQGVLRECLLASDVQRVTAVGRTATGMQHPKLRDRALLPRQILTTESVGQAMLAVARRGAPKPVLEPGDIYDAARGE